MAQIKKSIKRKKCAAYIRSTGYGPGRQLQLDTLHAFAQEREFEFIQVFEDVLPAEGRPGLTAALAAATDFTYDVLVVWRLDRLDSVAASPEKVLRLIKVLSESRVRLISIKDHIDSNDTGVDLVVAILKATERALNEIKGERIHQSLAASRAHGEPVGRPRIRDDEKIQTLRSGGRTIRQIAGELGISTWSVHASLKKGRMANLD